jgi:hypothetical protein
MDAYLPSDWNLQLIIKNNDKLSILGNREIGKKSFDLEDRFYGNVFRQYTLAYNLRMEHYKALEKKLKDRRSSIDPSTDRKRELEKILDSMKTLNEILKPKITERDKDPVEYCSLE